MRKVSILLAAALAVALPLSPISARQDLGLPHASPISGYEVVVFEAEGCVYCQSFRRDVLPVYASSSMSREAPIRFVNVSYSDETKMGLASAITIAPTVVLMREGQEVDRITGYPGPINFMAMMRHLLGRGE